MLRKQGQRRRRSEIETGFFQAIPHLAICLKIGSPHRLRPQRGMCCISLSCLAQNQGVEVSLEQEETSRANELSPMKTFTETAI